MRRTAVYRDNLFLEHEPGFGHVESPDRLRVIYDELDEAETGSELIYPGFDPASLDVIALNHTRDLINRVEDTQGREHDFLDADTQTSASSFSAACLAAGAVVDGIGRIVDGEVDNGFCLVRPPGHHAEKDRSMGFCLFNNVAVGAKWAIKELGLDRIFIFDWDLHHGNGTQHSFYDTDQVFYCSTHQYPFYPGTGSLAETGEGAGEGYTLNIPLPGGQGDQEFMRICREIVAPVVWTYRPELILVSCGFDIYGGDPLGSMRVSPTGFARMTAIMQQLADEVCGGRILVSLEGGYNLTAMRDGAMAVLTELYGEKLNEGHPDYAAEVLSGSGGEGDQWFIDQAVALAKSMGKM